MVTRSSNICCRSRQDMLYRIGSGGGVPQLERFKEAQNRPDSGLKSALAEMRNDCKQGHWIWYVFPQLSGLGTSSLSQKYAINDVAEAAEYLHDAMLCSRLLMITTTVAARVKSDGVSLHTLMSSSVDVRKLVSSLTLFRGVAKKLHASEGLEEYGALARVAEDVLAAAASEGYPPCRYTLARLAN
jgi:uncharacterized protein (DUF1810 family)